MGLPILAAMPQVLKKKKRMYNYTPPNEDQAKAVQEIFAKIKDKDTTNAECAKATSQPYVKYIKNLIPSVKVGT
jgi:hypothetical protein